MFLQNTTRTHSSLPTCYSTFLALTRLNQFNDLQVGYSVYSTNIQLFSIKLTISDGSRLKIPHSTAKFQMSYTIENSAPLVTEQFNEITASSTSSTRRIHKRVKAHHNTLIIFKFLFFIQDTQKHISQSQHSQTIN